MWKDKCLGLARVVAQTTPATVKVLVQDLGPAQAQATQAKVATGNTSRCDLPLPIPLCTLLINQRNHFITVLYTSMPYYVCVSLCIYLFVLYLMCLFIIIIINTLKFHKGHVGKLTSKIEVVGYLALCGISKVTNISVFLLLL